MEERNFLYISRHKTQWLINYSSSLATDHHVFFLFFYCFDKLFSTSLYYFLTLAPPSTACSSSTSNAMLSNNQFIYSPTHQLYAAGLLNNQFGVYNAYGYGNVTSTALWTCPQSSVQPNSSLAAQQDRNLVVYAGTGAVLWASNTGTSPFASYCLQMLDNGNLIWTNSTNSIIWQTNTAVGWG